MLGVVADDTTGANDIGIMFSKNRYTTKVVTFSQQMDINSDVDVLMFLEKAVNHLRGVFNKY